MLLAIFRERVLLGLRIVRIEKHQSIFYPAVLIIFVQMLTLPSVIFSKKEIFWESWSIYPFYIFTILNSSSPTYPPPKKKIKNKEEKV